MEEIHDIFVSYSAKDGELISRKVANALHDIGYSVYHNTDKNHKGKLPERIRRAVENCKDFLLIVTENCLDRLVMDDNSGKPDWVKEELLEAIECGKNIIPIMIESVDWPVDLSGLSDETASLIRDLSYRENIRLPVNFEKAPPFILLCGKLDSEPNDSSALIEGVFDTFISYLILLKKKYGELGCSNVKKLLNQLIDETDKIL